eukprot:CAMPEP_0182419756 /NCGR_PEP_ID=MMETSP1167-20130531/4136_1 /TAXON_ID=2988 /ORGANISM="Mallomonas Sp, Strain CCMP3275" /LENGTH=326 /DNA_ID=CAMNT_0024594837 /DNA_START=281 /DNA_END=1258 /DNA_ORIENTATION=-
MEDKNDEIDEIEGAETPKITLLSTTDLDDVVEQGSILTQKTSKKQWSRIRSTVICLIAFSMAMSMVTLSDISTSLHDDDNTLSEPVIADNTVDVDHSLGLETDNSPHISSTIPDQSSSDVPHGISDQGSHPSHQPSFMPHTERLHCPQGSLDRIHLPAGHQGVYLSNTPHCLRSHDNHFSTVILGDSLYVYEVGSDRSYLVASSPTGTSFTSNSVFTVTSSTGQITFGTTDNLAVITGSATTNNFRKVILQNDGALVAYTGQAAGGVAYWSANNHDFFDCWGEVRAGSTASPGYTDDMLSPLTWGQCRQMCAAAADLTPACNFVGW